MKKGRLMVPLFALWPTGAPAIDLDPLIPDRIAAAEGYGIALTNPPHARGLCAAGHADEASHRAFGRLPLAIGRKASMGAEVITGVDEIAGLLLGAEGIAYTGPGTSGKTYLAALDRLGLGQAVERQSHPMTGGGPMASVLAGESELAVQPLTSILPRRE